MRHSQEMTAGLRIVYRQLRRRLMETTGLFFIWRKAAVTLGIALLGMLAGCSTGGAVRPGTGPAEGRGKDNAQAGGRPIDRQAYVCALKADPPPVADGFDDDWSTVRGEFVMGDGNLTWGRDKYTGEDDLSGYIKLCYDANYLYLLADVVDDVILVDGGIGMFNADHVELDFAPAIREGVEGPKGDDWRIIGFSPGCVEESGDPLLDLEPEAYLVMPADIDWGGIDVGASMTENGYLLEARIPWHVLGVAPGQVKKGAVFGIEVHLSDSDTGNGQESMTTLDGRKWAGRRQEQIPRFILGDTEGRAE